MNAYAPLRPRDLAQALRDGELDIAYQAQWDLSEVWNDGLREARPIGVEALSRWKHATLGHVPPDAFIPLAQQGEFLDALDIAVLRRAVRQVVRWSTRGRPLALAVNAAPTHFSSTYADAAIRCASEAGLDPAMLTVEITETPSPQFRAVMTGPLASLHAAGIGVSVDDFGAGDTTIESIAGLPIAEVKIDRSLAQRTDAQADRIVGELVDAAREHGWRVVAEGIETVQDLERAVRRGCDRGQGFLWGRPVSAEQFEAASR
ncbi:EAL domain-containing protein [uncultured Microbacterium sp.]|uniref:EAL domain-containing protein n=1 Tax=uncultured Microbacterium sp. TaxID=191216 RepID=UPI0025DE4666|nr:EAL domain-containing protein [uncultured Microbacterium sp.]